MQKIAKNAFKEAINISNILTISRIPFGILWIYVFDSMFYKLTILFLVVLTDYLDGYLARRRNIITNIGRLLDPICDKFFVFVTFLTFFLSHQFSLTIFLLLIIRELGLATTFFLYLIFYRSRKLIIESRLLGKITTAFQFLLLIFMTLNLSWQNYVIFIVIFFGVLSLFDYIYNAYKSVFLSKGGAL
jgi:cardiolipin synthase